MRKLSALIPAVAILAIAGCGSSNSSSSSSSTEATTSATPTTTAPGPSGSASGSAVPSMSLAADPSGKLAYEQSTLTAKAGKVSIDFTNNSPLAHNVTIESASKQIVGATPSFQGGSRTLTVNLKPGTYKFFCSVPGHRMAGMEGTLTVK